MRNTMLAIGLLIAGLSANFIPASTRGAVDRHTESAGPRANRPGHAKLPDDHPLNLIYDYFHPDRQRSKASAPQARSLSGSLQLNGSPPAARLLDLHWEAAPGGNDNTEDPDAIDPIDEGDISFLVATVPDPQRTHMALYFDRYVESMISAAGDCGYNFDRYWLPWRIENEPDAQDLDKAEKSLAEKKRRGRLPGLLLFRGPQKTGSVSVTALAIFLVGETPTGGIDRHQFYNAVHFVGRLKPPAKPLKLLGPSFSGSLESVQRALQEDLPAEMKSIEHKIISGTASSQVALTAFHANQTGFRTTVHSDLYVIQQMLADNLFNGQSLAIVAEDATVYGDDFAKLKIASQPLLIYYPREISLLRNAYQDDPVLAAQQSGKAAPGTRQQLAMGLKDTQIARDTLPQFSAEQTPITQETALVHVAETLKHAKIQIAILSGTNVLDVLFLGRFLRQASPNVRLVVLDSDLLFVHATDTLDYQGMLALSTYPLVPANLLWTEMRKPFQPRRRRFFASNGAEGVYNACLLLMRASDKDQPALQEYSAPPPEFSQHPPVWLTAIGRSGYWPISLLGGTQPDPLLRDLEPGQPAAFRIGGPTHIFSTVFASLSLFTFAFVCAAVYARRCSRPLKRWCADLDPEPDATVCPWRVFYLLLTIICALLTYYVLARAPMALAAYPGSPWLWRSYAILAAVLIVLLFAMVVSTAWKLPSRALRLVAGLPILLGLWWWFAVTGDAKELFRAMRSVQLLSGVAPNLPVVFLLAALLWWSWTQMQRFIFAQERIVFVPELKELPASLVQPLNNLLEQPFLHGNHFGKLLMISSLVSVFWASAAVLRSLESGRYDFSFSVLLASVAAALIGMAYCYLRIWHELRRCLENLELHPLRQAFSMLPGITSWSSWWQPSTRKRSYEIPLRSLECLRLLHSVAPNYYADLAADLEQFDSQANVIRETVQRGERESSIVARQANKWAASIAGNLGAALEAGPWRNGSSTTLAKLEKEQAEQLDDRGLIAAEFIALRYVAFIRYVILHLRNLLSFITVGFILCALALNSYPFQGGNLVRWWVTGVFVILSVVVIIVLAGMERDAVLSRLTDSTAGKLESGFYLKLISAGALPILTVVASHFPLVGRFLFSWVQPALSAMH